MRRSYLEQVVDLFQAVKRNPTYSLLRVIAVSGISFKKGYGMLHKFTDEGFIILEPKNTGKRRCGRHARLTEKGWKWLQQITPLIEMVVECEGAKQ